MAFALEMARDRRVCSIEDTDESIRAEYGQYLTPVEVAKHAADLFSDSDTAVTCLDLGSGSGVLSAALFERYGKSCSVVGVEQDERIAAHCSSAYDDLPIQTELIVGDALAGLDLGHFDRVVLNPPYRKMSSRDLRQSFLPVKAPNLYAAFMCIAIQHLAEGGECVAIVPRSWMNGRYFAPFRKWVLENVSIDAMHIYDSRTEIFADLGVLQEIMLVKFSRKTQGDFITVTASKNVSSSVATSYFRFTDLVNPLDDDLVISVEPMNTVPSLTLLDVGVRASTGKVVEYRVKDALSSSFKAGFETPVLFSCNLRKSTIVHPLSSSRKPQWMETVKSVGLTVPPGYYVLVKRFAPKEEERRLQAFILDSDVPVAIENHVNVIHAGTKKKTVPLAKDIAEQLCRLINAPSSDTVFRSYGGSTQVNASDLNRLPVDKECLR
ncbi:MAG: Eco57I restriction-modification methylase domain-containing protein [Raoultibacter sp.]